MSRQLTTCRRQLGLIPNRPRTEDLSFVSPVSQSNRTYYEEPVPEPAQEPSSPEAPSIERGNKLLSFQPSTCNHAVFDYPFRQSTASLAAQLHGMFFLAESARTGTGELVSSPPELTCYRRNLFQITGSVTLPRMLTYIVNEQGERIPIVSQELTVSATESVEGSPVKIISVPWKTPAAGTAPAPEEKVEKEPTAIALDQPANPDVDSEYSVFPIAWKRLQFRVATANNGRRRELQQHFTIRLSVVANLSNGSRVSLCDALSGHIVVRGRSPRNFQQRKDVPLSGSGASMRKSISSATSMSPAIRRGSTLDSMHQAALPKIEHPPNPMYSMSPSSAHPRRSSPGGYEWQSAHPVTAPVSPYMQPSPEMSVPAAPTLKRKSTEPAAPALGLTVPENGMYSQRSSAPPPERPRKMSRADGPHHAITTSSYAPPLSASSLPPVTYSYAPSTSAATHYSVAPAKSEASEVMHNYFPMHMDAPWLPAGDHVYRPQILHPTTTVGGPGSGRGGYYGHGI